VRCMCHSCTDVLQGLIGMNYGTVCYQIVLMSNSVDELPDRVLCFSWDIMNHSHSIGSVHFKLVYGKTSM
jgi:hypothetical protein